MPHVPTLACPVWVWANPSLSLRRSGASWSAPRRGCPSRSRPARPPPAPPTPPQRPTPTLNLARPRPPRRRRPPPGPRRRLPAREARPPPAPPRPGLGRGLRRRLRTQRGGPRMGARAATRTSQRQWTRTAWPLWQRLRTSARRSTSRRARGPCSFCCGASRGERAAAESQRARSGERARFKEFVKREQCVEPSLQPVGRALGVAWRVGDCIALCLHALLQLCAVRSRSALAYGTTIAWGPASSCGRQAAQPSHSSACRCAGRKRGHMLCSSARRRSGTASCAASSRASRRSRCTWNSCPRTTTPTGRRAPQSGACQPGAATLARATHAPCPGVRMRCLARVVRPHPLVASPHPVSGSGDARGQASACAAPPTRLPVRGAAGGGADGGSGLGLVS